MFSKKTMDENRLKDYISHAKSLGIENSKILESLLKAGWDDGNIKRWL